MTDKPGKRHKRPIALPPRPWPPPRDPEVEAGPLGETEFGRAEGEKGLAAADDVIEWLVLQMNEQGTSIDELSRNSGVAVRTIKKWFGIDPDKRAMPNLRSIQACLEVLGYSLIPAGPTIAIDESTHYLPAEIFRRDLLMKSLEQEAKSRRMTIDEVIESREKRFRLAADRGTTGPRRRTQ